MGKFVLKFRLMNHLRKKNESFSLLSKKLILLSSWNLSSTRPSRFRKFKIFLLATGEIFILGTPKNPDRKSNKILDFPPESSVKTLFICRVIGNSVTSMRKPLKAARNCGFYGMELHFLFLEEWTASLLLLWKLRSTTRRRFWGN